MTTTEYIDTLQEKLDTMTRILEATKLLELTGKGDEENLEREAELFSSLYEQRADVIINIQQMDEALGKYKADGTSDAKAKKITDKIKETAKAIVELDKKHIAASEKLTVFLRGNLKQIRDGRDVSGAYSDDAASTSGYYFDRKN